MKKINPWMILSIILVLIVIGLLFGKQITGFFIIATPQEIANKTMNYLNEKLVAPNTTATFLYVKDFNGLYNVTFFYQNQTLSAFVTRDGNYVFLTNPLKIGEKITIPQAPEQTLGNFLIDEKSDVCKEDGKPIVYFFGSQKCPHCMWEDPIIINATGNFKDQISFHENIDTEKDSEIFLKYSPSGYIPLIVIGCKYYRVGSGEEFGEANEIKILTSLTCLVTNNKPLSTCATVEDILNQIR